MSTIDEIRAALELCARRPDRMNFTALELMITAALAEARREGAEIEAQEPVVWAPSCANQEFAASVRGDGDMLTVWFDRPAPGSTLRGACQTPLYARHVPAIPADPGMLTVSMAPSSAYASGWNDCRAKMINAAPEPVNGLVSVFSYDDVLTFKFRTEAEADKFMDRFEPTVDSAAPEYKE